MTEKTSLRQDYRAAFRLLGLVRRMNASILPQRLLHAMLGAWIPYISLFFTAQLINNLTSGAYREALLATGWLLGSNLILGSVKDYLASRWKQSAGLLLTSMRCV